MSPHVRYPLLIVCIAFATACEASTGQHTIRSAVLDSTGQLKVELSNARVIVPARDSDQVAFEQVAFSSDHSVVGWVNRYPNCCTSYPVPLKLVLLRASGERTVIAPVLPIWQWAFADSGRVVIRTAPVHGGAASYELRDMRTGSIVTSVESDSSNAEMPAWTRAAVPRVDSAGLH
jgi:hypothetical protein